MQWTVYEIWSEKERWVTHTIGTFATKREAVAAIPAGARPIIRMGRAYGYHRTKR